MRILTKLRPVLLFLFVCMTLASCFAQFAISVRIGPPALPVYEQPPCPHDGYLWTPGYWAYGPEGYYWVPGVWVAPPRIGLLWTPGYWAYDGGVYGWRAGYWGPHVGFYGGVHYGFGYEGVGFVGGMWSGGVFRYNTAVMHVDTRVVRNVYVNRTVINNTVVNRTSFNGPGGVNARPRGEEEAAMREQHFQPTSNQISHEQAMAHDRNQFASMNHGTPRTAAMDSVNGRRFNQQGRIANGVGSGHLTAGETKNLEGREARVNGEIHTDRAANGGKLTPQERQQVNRQQNRISGSIYDDKHNANNAHYGNNEVGARRDMQQQRIANGVRSGQMSPSEAAKAENREQNINRHVAADRNANGGKLTPQEKRNVNQRQNGASREIHNEKHNEKTAPR